MSRPTSLPVTPPDAGQPRPGTGAAGLAGAAAALDAHRDRVSRHFHAVVFGAAAAVRRHGVAVDLESPEDAVRRLSRRWPPPDADSAGRAMPLPAAQRLAQLREAGFVRRLDVAGRRRLQALLPQLLTLIARVPHPRCDARAGAEDHRGHRQALGVLRLAE